MILLDRIYGCGLMMYRPMGLSALTRRPLATVDVFRVTACNLSKVTNCNFSTSVLSVLGLLVVTDRCIVLCLMYSRDYFDDYTSTVIDRVVHFRLTWYLLTTFRRHRNLFFKVRLQIFRRRVPASCRCLQCPPIRRCIINLHRYILCVILKNEAIHRASPV